MGKSPKSPNKLVNTLVELYYKASPKMKNALGTIMASPRTAKKRNDVVDIEKQATRGEQVQNVVKEKIIWC